MYHRQDRRIGGLSKWLARRLALVLLSFLTAAGLSAGYRQPGHYQPAEGSIPVSAPGVFAKAGATYVLTGDLASPTTAVFLGRDVTLDLNGYTLTYADADYGHVTNYDFENGLEGWDLSGAPGARIEDTEKVHVFIGRRILRLARGDQIVSDWVRLPIAGRSYFAMCGVLTWEMKVSLFVEDESGKEVRVVTDYGDSTRLSCPVESRSPRLGGGFVLAHLHGLPAGLYRVRVRADTDCLVDHIDIRPAMDVGVAIVDQTHPGAHNDQLYNGDHCAFFDYTVPGSSSEPLAWVPRAAGPGTVVIRNGVIRSAAVGILSWGVQSTAPEVKVILDNVRVVAAGINTNAVDVPQAVITDCRFDIETPFIINRHVSEHAVVLRGPAPSEVSYSEFFGGQGCLNFLGENSIIHHNLFVNRQTVTNHYCIMARGDGSKIFANRLEPEIGSGIEIFRHNRIDIFDNEFRIEAAPPTCEYGHEEYSTTAIRIADYNARPGASDGCSGNRIYNNRMYITGRDYPQYPDYIPMAWAFFYSVSGGDNFIFNNDILVRHRDPGTKAEASAFYVGGGSIGGVFSDNRVTSNVPVAWIGNPYGEAEGTVFEKNRITASPDALPGFRPIRIGYSGRETSAARDIKFRSNEFIGCSFGVDSAGRGHGYSVAWTLTVKAVDRDHQPVRELMVEIEDRRGTQTVSGQTGADGVFTAELLEYSVAGELRTDSSPYMVKVGKMKKKVELRANSTIEFSLK